MRKIITLPLCNCQKFNFKFNSDHEEEILGSGHNMQELNPLPSCHMRLKILCLYFVLLLPYVYTTTVTINYPIEVISTGRKTIHLWNMLMREISILSYTWKFLHIFNIYTVTWRSLKWLVLNLLRHFLTIGRFC